MQPDFTDITSYLPSGTPRQRRACELLARERIMERLAAFDPLLAGTIPIGIDLPGSDLDIVCHCPDLPRLAVFLRECFGAYEGFVCREEPQAVVAAFRAGEFEIEVFGQDVPSARQNAFRHMLVEHAILQREGEEFRRQIIELKRKGMKTEPAFALLLGLEGDPYEALLEYRP